MDVLWYLSYVTPRNRVRARTGTCEHIFHELVQKLHDSNVVSMKLNSVPQNVDVMLLRNTLAAMRKVEIVQVDRRMQQILYNALVHMECAIEELVLHGFVFDDKALADVFKRNKSVRFLRCNTPEMLRLAEHSKTIEDIQIDSDVDATRIRWGRLLRMRSLRRVRRLFLDSRRIHRWWPNGVRINHHTVIRDSGAQMYSQRQKLRALYECAGKILPDHVINDIVDSMPAWILQPQPL
jgi:hypothetical protein